MFGFFKKILGSKSDKDLKDLYPLVEKINSEFDLLSSLSDEDLRNKTDLFKKQINDNLKETNSEIKDLKKKYKEPKISLSEKEILLNDIDKIEESQNEIIEKTLNEILPQAFAVIKETARRFTENKKLELIATDFDHEIAKIKDNVVIKGSKAIWKNEWEAAGVPIEWNMIHYDV